MNRYLAASSLVLLAATGTVAVAQPMVPADSPQAAALPPTAPTMVDNTLPPPPADSIGKSYPVCTGKMQDSCQNPGEGGASGHSRASSHSRHHRS